ncbi:hypothetical protein QBC34DRAFT_474909 [Podospora aff. communis PSN243]|uniref:Tetraspanin n=1 Tax=Podospora aff. communis PSN243 TaxID=3040156 RepID=A0AAV9GA42_9PEZI|nr:hypothetical protein QBC34DRAFT_474909 [Podospora aff. communis PSN243]
MASWMIALFPLLILALTGIAIYAHNNIHNLSLPIPSTLTILPILLPLLTLLLPLLLPRLLPKPNPHSPSNTSKPRPSPLSNLLPILTTILTTALATLLLSPSTPTPLRDCLLETKWKSLWQSHSASSIRAIQDALDCCGFRTTKDMAWPFPSGPPGSGSGAETCVMRYPGRTQACREPWAAAMQSGAGWDAGVVIVVGVVQVLGLVYGRGVVGEEGWEGSVWGRLGRWVGSVVFGDGRRGGGDRGEGARPLLEGGRVEDVEEDGEGDVAREEGFRYGGAGADRREV